jgi:hypothetical protein
MLDGTSSGFSAFDPADAPSIEEISSDHDPKELAAHVAASLPGLRRTNAIQAYILDVADGKLPPRLHQMSLCRSQGSEALRSLRISLESNYLSNSVQWSWSFDCLRMWIKADFGKARNVKSNARFAYVSSRIFKGPEATA